MSSFARPAHGAFVLAAAAVTLGLTSAAGCSTKSADCDNILARYNANVVELKKIDVKTGADAEKVSTVLEKYATEMKGLAIPDEGAKSKLGPYADAELARGKAMKELAEAMKALEPLAKPEAPTEGTPEEIKAKIDKLNADVERLGNAIDAKGKDLETASAAKDKAWLDVAGYCGITMEK